MNKIKGQISFEAVVYICFAIVIAVTAASYARFYFFKQASRAVPCGTMAAYDELLSSLRADSGLAAGCKTKANAVSFFNAAGELISVYELYNGCVRRLSPKNEEAVLLKNAAAAEFTVDSKLKSLLHVLIEPKDTNLGIFFTSFALRAYEVNQNEN